MVSQIRIPFLIDLIRVSDPATIRALADNAWLDRGHSGGPLVNRLISNRLRGVLRTPAAPLPTVQGRDAAGRADAQVALAQRLDRTPVVDLLDGYTLDRLAAAVCGDTDAVGPMAQQLIGRLFVDDFQATEETWSAARTLQAAVEGGNLMTRAMWRLTGRVRSAQRTLSEAVGGDPAAVHATGIAVHNLVDAVETLANLHRDGGDRLSHAEVLARAMVAPRTVVRQAVAHADTVVGTVRPGTLVTFELRDAARRSLDPRELFMHGAWSQCPAHGVVPQMVAAVWARAIGTDGAAP